MSVGFVKHYPRLSRPPLAFPPRQVLSVAVRFGTGSRPLQPRTGQQFRGGIGRLSRPRMFNIFCAIRQLRMWDLRHATLAQFRSLSTPQNHYSFSLPQLFGAPDTTVASRTPTNTISLTASTACTAYRIMRHPDVTLVGIRENHVVPIAPHLAARLCHDSRIRRARSALLPP